MLIDVRNLKDVERVSTLIKECYTKALCEDAVVIECVEVLTATPDLVRLSGSLPHKPSQKDIITALLRGQKLVVYFSNSRATTPEEMDIISKYFATYQKLLDYVENYTIDKAIRSGAKLKDILNELSLYEANERTIVNKVIQEGTPKCENKMPKRATCRVRPKVEPYHIPLMGGFTDGKSEIEKVLKDMVDNIIDANTGCVLSKDTGDNHLQKCKDNNITTVMAKSTGDLTVFTFYRDKVTFDFPVPTRELKSLKGNLAILLDPPLQYGFYHTSVEYKGEPKQVHLGLTGKTKNAIFLQVRDNGESKGNVFTMHKSSELLFKFRLLINETIKFNESIGRC